MELCALDISVIGANGDCGREIVNQLLRSRVMTGSERLQLVGRDEPDSRNRLFGLACDLQDAYAENCPVLDLAYQPEDVLGDLIIMAAGKTIGSQCPTRDELAEGNLPLFRRMANAIAQGGYGHELVIVVSNPIELCVQVFAEALGRHRVLGMGAHSDSLRFRLELARDLHIRRQRIRALMLGEHGNEQVPLWSQVQVFGLEPEEHQRWLQRFLQGRDIRQFVPEVTRYQHQLMQLLDCGQMDVALSLLNSVPPDIRTVLRPYITHWSGAKTVYATAHATVDLVQEVVGGFDKVVPVQVLLQGEWCDIHGPFGAPVVLTANGWNAVVELPLTAAEEALVRQASASINQKYDRLLCTGETS